MPWREEEEEEEEEEEGNRGERVISISHLTSSGISQMACLVFAN
jgi:hypothetical protein